MTNLPTSFTPSVRTINDLIFPEQVRLAADPATSEDVHLALLELDLGFHDSHDLMEAIIENEAATSKVIEAIANKLPWDQFEWTLRSLMNHPNIPLTLSAVIDAVVSSNFDYQPDAYDIIERSLQDSGVDVVIAIAERTDKAPFLPKAAQCVYAQLAEADSTGLWRIFEAALSVDNQHAMRGLLNNPNTSTGIKRSILSLYPEIIID